MKARQLKLELSDKDLLTLQLMEAELNYSTKENLHWGYNRREHEEVLRLELLNKILNKLNEH